MQINMHVANFVAVFLAWMHLVSLVLVSTRCCRHIYFALRIFVWEINHSLPPLLTHRESFSYHNFCRAICLVSHKLSLKSLVIFFDRIAIRDHRTLQLAPDYYYNKVDKWCFICFTTCMKCAFDSPQQTLPYFKQTKLFRPTKTRFRTENCILCNYLHWHFIRPN